MVFVGWSIKLVAEDMMETAVIKEDGFSLAGSTVSGLSDLSDPYGSNVRNGHPELSVHVEPDSHWLGHC